MTCRHNLFIVLFFLQGLTYAQSGKISVEISGFQNTEGLARITLFNQNQGFPSKYQFGIRSKSIKLDTTTILVVFDSLAYGEYAVSVLHDKNSNGKMDTNLIGVPREGYGVSNNVNPKMRAPRFEEALFFLNASEIRISILLSYR